ncbi:MAG: carboxypeptidase-like regulatory domain-containing protein, partial [Ekhidna sp.]|nr:carboxypeptidase-like regulatory domain-containing protein [Ekhidna sp.]
MKRLSIAFLFLLHSLFSEACLVLFLSDGEKVLVGNHEDWFANDAALKILPPSSSRYGSIIFTFESEGWAQGGMNEHGLFFDAVYTPYQSIEFESSKKEYEGYLWQTILDKCRNIDEALELLSGYSIPELEEAHIILADAGGDAVLLGVDDGKIAIERVKDLLLQTNFNPWNPELSDEPYCERYKKSMEILSNTSEVSEHAMLEVLKNTHQDSLTVYSNIYDLQNRTVTIFDRRKFDRPLHISIDQAFERGNCVIAIPSMIDEWEQTVCKDVLLLQGLVTDELGKPLPFVNIGVAGTDFGTISDPDGSYILELTAAYQDSEVTFSSIGYHTKTYSADNLYSIDQIELKEEIKLLEEVVVNKPSNFRKARLGHMGGKDGILPFDTAQGGAATALLLKSPKDDFYVDQVQFRLLYNSKDTLQLRLHFYAYDSACACPGEELLKEEKVEIMNNFMKKMRMSGYNERIRKTVMKATVGIVEKRKKTE